MHYDIIIVGGGLVGAGLACALFDTDLSIALIDARLPANDDPRLLALNYSSCQFLKNVGLWPAVAMYATPIHQVHVSHQGHFGAVRLTSRDASLPELGHVVPAYHLEQGLHMQLKKHANVTIYQPATLKLLTQNENHTSLLLQIDGKEQTLFSTCIIAADGTASTVRAQLNIPVERIDYEQTALVVRTTLQRPHQHIAYERFVHIGAIAMLPLQDNADQPECATIWSGDNATIAHLMTLSANDFLGRLQKEFGYRLGRLQKIGTRYTYPLQMVKAQRSEVGHVLLLGNSAHTLHPIAAQGLNLALYEAAMLVEKIKMLRTLQRPLTAQDLAIVDKSFKQHQTISMSISHRLTQLFAKTSSVRSMLLSLGMLSLDILTPVKRKFINRMIGKSDRLPHLLLNMNETYVKKSG